VPTLQLTTAEAATLADVLRSYLSDLRAEIAGTDRLEFREELKRTEVLLKRWLAELGDRGSPGGPSAA
jgi:hypothetical protein